MPEILSSLVASGTGVGGAGVAVAGRGVAVGSGARVGGTVGRGVCVRVGRRVMVGMAVATGGDRYAIGMRAW